MDATLQTESNAPLKLGSLLLWALFAVTTVFMLKIIWATRHGDRDSEHNASAAQQCLNENGVYQQMKETNDRVHLICVDKITGKIYDVIIKSREVVEGITTYEVTKYKANGEWVAIKTVQQYIDVLLAQGKMLAPTTVHAPFEFVWP